MPAGTPLLDYSPNGKRGKVPFTRLVPQKRWSISSRWAATESGRSSHRSSVASRGRSSGALSSELCQMWLWGDRPTVQTGHDLQWCRSFAANGGLVGLQVEGPRASGWSEFGCFRLVTPFYHARCPCSLCNSGLSATVSKQQCKTCLPDLSRPGLVV